MNIKVFVFFFGKDGVTVTHENNIMICVKVLATVLLLAIVLVSTARGQLCNGPGNFCYNSTSFGICINQANGSFVPLDLVLQCPVGSTCVPNSYYPCSFNTSFIATTTEFVNVNYSDTSILNKTVNINLNSSNEQSYLHPTTIETDIGSETKVPATTDLNNVSISIVEDANITIIESPTTNKNTNLNPINKTTNHNTDDVYTIIELSTEENTQLYNTDFTETTKEPYEDGELAHTTNYILVKTTINLDGSIHTTERDNNTNFDSASSVPTASESNSQSSYTHSTDNIHRGETEELDEIYSRSTEIITVDITFSPTDATPDTISDISTKIVPFYSTPNAENNSEESNSVTTDLILDASSETPKAGTESEFSTNENYEITDEALQNNSKHNRTTNILEVSTILPSSSANEASDISELIELTTNFYKESTKDEHSTYADEHYSDSTTVAQTIMSVKPATSVDVELSSIDPEISTLNKEIAQTGEETIEVSENISSGNSSSTEKLNQETLSLRETTFSSATEKVSFITEEHQSSTFIGSSTDARVSTTVSHISTNNLINSEQTEKPTGTPSTLEITKDDTTVHKIAETFSVTNSATEDQTTKYVEATNMPEYTADYKTTVELTSDATFKNTNYLKSSTSVKPVITTTESVEGSTDSSKTANNTSVFTGGPEHPTDAVTLIVSSSSNSIFSTSVKPVISTIESVEGSTESSKTPNNTSVFTGEPEHLTDTVTLTVSSSLNSIFSTSVKPVITTTESVECSTESSKTANNSSVFTGGPEHLTDAVTLTVTSSSNSNKITSDVPTTSQSVTSTDLTVEETTTTFNCARYGVFKDPTDCSKFHVCLSVGIFGTRHVEIKCRPNLGFSSLFKKCVPSHISDCLSLTSTSVKSTTSATTESTTIITNPPEIFRCKTFGAFSDPHDCTKFYICYRVFNQVVQKVIQCKSGYAFSKFTKTCVPQHISGCFSQTSWGNKYNRHEYEDNIRFPYNKLDKREKDFEEERRKAEENRKKAEKELQEKLKKQQKEAEENREREEKELQEKIKKQQKEAEENRKREEKELQEKLKKQQKEAEENREREEKELQEKIKKQQKEAEENRERQEKELQEKLKKQQKEAEEERKRNKNVVEEIIRKQEQENQKRKQEEKRMENEDKERRKLEEKLAEKYRKEEEREQEKRLKEGNEYKFMYQNYFKNDRYSSVEKSEDSDELFN